MDPLSLKLTQGDSERIFFTLNTYQVTLLVTFCDTTAGIRNLKVQRNADGRQRTTLTERWTDVNVEIEK